MAQLFAFYSFNMAGVDFSDLYYDAIDVDYQSNIFLPFDGRLIEDIIGVTYAAGDVLISTLIGGGGFAPDGDFSNGGTVTLIGESLDLGSDTEPLWLADRLNVPLPDLFAAMQTVSVDDDRRLVERAFSGNDLFMMSDEADAVFGFDGTDTMYGYGGADLLGGGAGNDVIYGGAQNDYLLMDAGNDRLDGGSGSDWLSVEGAAATRIDLAVTGRQVTGQGVDVIRFIENIDGDAGVDRLFGNGAANILRGHGGNDVLSGRSGNDRLDGGFGNDALDGGLGRDVLVGGGNTDRLTGGAGADRLTGGVGADIFIFRALSDSRGAQADVITDFRPGTDLINLSAIDANLRVAGNQRFDFDTEGALRIGQVDYRHVGGQTHVTMDVNGDGRADGLIRLAGTLTLSEGDFIL